MSQAPKSLIFKLTVEIEGLRSPMLPAATCLVPLLQSYFDWNLARTKCIAHVLLGLIQVRSVNLEELAQTLPSTATLESRYKRLQRLFKEFKIDFALVAQFIASQLPYETFALSLDRTNWKLGKANINILCLGIIHQGISIPILWVLLPKKGNSNTAERIALLERFIALFGRKKIAFIAADREFIGTAWVGYLLENKIKFRLRIKANSQIGRKRGGSTAAKNFFRNLAPGEALQLDGKRTLWGHQLYITGVRLTDGKYLIIITSDPSTCAQILADYKQRWEIETLFKALKSQGFDLEATHMTAPERIEKLIAFLAIALCWAHRIGEWRHQQKPIPIKTHQRPAKSVFRYGLDLFRDIIFHITERYADFYFVVGLFFGQRSTCKVLV